MKKRETCKDCGYQGLSSRNLSEDMAGIVVCGDCGLSQSYWVETPQAFITYDVSGFGEWDVTFYDCLQDALTAMPEFVDEYGKERVRLAREIPYETKSIVTLLDD